MNLLLDTHIWIWNHLAPWKISSEVNGILAASQNELWLSPVSIWELLVLLEKKRLELDKDPHDWSRNQSASYCCERLHFPGKWRINFVPPY